MWKCGNHACETTPPLLPGGVRVRERPSHHSRKIPLLSFYRKEPKIAPCKKATYEPGPPAGRVRPGFRARWEEPPRASLMCATPITPNLTLSPPRHVPVPTLIRRPVLIPSPLFLLAIDRNGQVLCRECQQQNPHCVAKPPARPPLVDTRGQNRNWWGGKKASTHESELYRFAWLNIRKCTPRTTMPTLPPRPPKQT